MATELAKAYVQIVPTAKGISGNLKSIFSGSEATNATQKAGGTIGSTLVSGAKGAMMAGAAGLVTVGATVGGMVAKSVSSYANYEQLTGGIETLFKDSADIVMGYAKNAYVTAGMSANDYMETVTGFSASLIQSLGEDTNAASVVANRAIVDMSDNANKMGTSMESIQNAYQGFAKQNYTMLDNLKLGYGGTKEEMARLISDASKMTDEMEALGVSVDADNMSFSNIVNAISVVQKHLGITGTTALEASDTISGSAGQIKAAWANLLTGMADPSQDMGVLIESFVNSFTTVAKNLVPRITATVPRVVEGLSQVLQIVAKEIPSLIEDLLPAVIDGVKSLIKEVVNILPSLVKIITKELPTFIKGVVEIVKGIAEALPKILQELLNVIPTLIPELVGGVTEIVIAIADALPGMIVMIVDSLPAIIQSICDALIKNLPLLINATTKLISSLAKSLPKIASTLYSVIPILVRSVAELVIKNLPTLLAAAVTIIGEIVKQLPSVIKSYAGGWKSIFTTLIDVLEENFPAVFAFLGNVWDKITLTVSTGIKLIASVISAGFQIITLPFRFIWENCKESVISVLGSIQSYIKQIFGNIASITSSVWTGIKTTITTIVGGIKTAITPIISSISTTISTVFGSIKTTASTIWKNVKDAMVGPIETAKTKIKEIVGTIKGYFSGMKLSFPNIKLPHFGVNPKNWKIDDLLRGVVPTLKIDWYAKAMNEPFMFTRPTVVGRGFGEAGDEMVYGRNNLMRDISLASGSSEEQKLLRELIDTVEDMQKAFYGDMVDALESVDVKFNGRELGRLVQKYA